MLFTGISCRRLPSILMRIPVMNISTMRLDFPSRRQYMKSTFEAGSCFANVVAWFRHGSSQSPSGALGTSLAANFHSKHYDGSNSNWCGPRHSCWPRHLSRRSASCQQCLRPTKPTKVRRKLCIQMTVPKSRQSH